MQIKLDLKDELEKVIIEESDKEFRSPTQQIMCIISRYYLGGEKGRSSSFKSGRKYTMTIEQWERCMEFFGYRCAYSGESFEGDLHKDHVIPFSKGGADDFTNLIPCKARYNISKGNKEMESWYRKQEFFNEERLERIKEYLEMVRENEEEGN